MAVHGKSLFAGPIYKYCDENLSKDNFFVGTDQKNLLRANGIERSKITDGRAPSQITVSNGWYTSTRHRWAHQTSDWAIRVVLLYNRELNDEEMRSTEYFLRRMYMDDSETSDTSVTSSSLAQSELGSSAFESTAKFSIQYFFGSGGLLLGIAIAVFASIISKLPRVFRIAQQSDEAVVIGGVGDGDEVGSLLVSNGVSTDKTAYGAVL